MDPARPERSERRPAAGSEHPIGEHPIGEHPIGTLVIVLIYALLFLVGWLLIYFFVFLPRGPIGG